MNPRAVNSERPSFAGFLVNIDMLAAATRSFVKRYHKSETMRTFDHSSPPIDPDVTHAISETGPPQGDFVLRIIAGQNGHLIGVPRPGELILSHLAARDIAEPIALENHVKQILIAAVVNSKKACAKIGFVLKPQMFAALTSGICQNDEADQKLVESSNNLFAAIW